MSWFSKLKSLFGSSQEEVPIVPQRARSVSQQVVSEPPQNPVISQPPPNQVISQPTMITIKVKIVNDQPKTVTVNKNMTGRQLKQHIFDHLSQQLQPGTMSLKYKGTKITNNMKLGELNIVVAGQLLQIEQEKAPLNEVVSAIVDANGVDPISQEIGTAKMPCGHSVGKETMTGLIQSLISSNKYQIRCPVTEDNQACNVLWDFALCRKIGVLTLTEVETFQNGLSQNWLKENAKICPKCKSSIFKHNLTINRVVCPKCKFGDFCFLCLKKWNNGNNDFCGNEQCKFRDEFLRNSPWNRKFNLIDQLDGNKTKVYMAPQNRACVYCFSIIQHKVGCKHMKCTSCKKEFCWICLAKKPENGTYPCGSYNTYCGKTAQVQKISNN